jgi:hypothetical protein
MQNIRMTRKKNLLVIEIDLGKDFGPSSSGKTVIVASSRGNTLVPGTPDTYLGLNCFRRINNRKIATPENE